MLGDSLAGIRILDFSHVLAGPVCSMTLADLGAHVTKIEPLNGELGRNIGPPWINGESPTFMSVNRNKYSLAIDLKTEDGRAVLRQMVCGADVILENFRPGVMASLGLDFTSLRELNDKLVYCSISAFGQSGSNRSRPGVDGAIQALSGLMSTIGNETGEPLKVPVPVADMVTGYLASVAILGALYKALAGGGGQHIDVSLYNATIMLQQIGYAAYFASGAEPEKSGSAAPYAAPNEVYPTRDGWLMVVAYHPQRWTSLCDILMAPELEKDLRFATNDARVRNRKDLHRILAGYFVTKDSDDWLAALSARDIICAPVATYGEVMQSQEYAESGLVRTVSHPVAGVMKMHGFQLAPGAITDADKLMPAPLIGQHSLEVMRLYGVADQHARDLLERGIVHSDDRTQQHQPAA